MNLFGCFYQQAAFGGMVALTVMGWNYGWVRWAFGAFALAMFILLSLVAAMKKKGIGCK